MKVAGLMSGTSTDGVDVALVEFGDSDESPVIHLVAFRFTPYTDVERAEILGVVERGTPSQVCSLHAKLGDHFGDAVSALLSEADVDAREVAAVGSHGHTLWHDPPVEGDGATLQLGDPSRIAARTGIPVVSDFRSADVAAGGQGAPLVPWPDQLLFARPGVSRAIQNLGGIGNVTWLPPRGDRRDPVAFDTGPGNVLLDLAAEQATGGRMRCDVDGAIARAGTPDRDLLERLMAHPFLQQPPPRSTGREAFGRILLDPLIDEWSLQPGSEMTRWSDLLATLTAFTASTIGEAYRSWVVPLGVDEVLLAGGGAENPTLVGAICDELDSLPVRTGADALGVDPDAREAAAFAVLAWAHLRKLPANVPSVTGAAGPRVLGSLTPSPGR